MEGCSITSSCEDTPMQNEDSITVTAASNQSASNSVTLASTNILNNQGLTIYRSPNLPPTHYILLKSPLVGGNLTAENCLIVDVSQLQQQNLTIVPSITQQVAPPIEEQDSKERVQNYIRTLSIPGTSSNQPGVVTADDEQTSQQQQFSQSGSLNDRGVIFGQVDAQQQQSATGSINVNNSISETAKLVSAQLSSVVYDQQQQCKQQQQQQSLECSENGVLLESSGGGGPSSIPQGAIMTTNVSMVNVLASSSSAVISPSCSSSSPSAAVAQQLLGASLSSVTSGTGGGGVPANLQSVLASTLQNHLTSFPSSVMMSNPSITNSAGGVIDLQEYRTPNTHGSVSMSGGVGGSGNGGTGVSGGMGAFSSGGGGGVASYSNVTSPSAYTSPSEEDEQMDNSNDLLSSDNEDISDINRSLIHSGNLERHPNGSSGQNSGTATPGGGSSSLANSGGGGGVAADYAWPHLQQLNMANGLGGDLPTMVTKDASGMSGDSLEGSSAVTTLTGGNDVTTISSDSFSDSGVMNGGLSSKCPSSSTNATSSNHHNLHNNNSYQHQQPQQTQARQKRPFDSSSAVAMYSRHTLIQHFPQCQEGVSLEVVNQPESRHRPRYLTEGSRGSVKDRTGNGYPAVRLSGFSQCPLTLQVFIGTDTGRPKPHGFFQACRVTGRNVISCLERNIDGTQIMEIDLDPKNDMRADIDCVGILKLRNSDVEAMESTTRSKKKSQRARMVFRVTVPKADGSSFTLQTMSETIQCSQPTGQPEIARLTVDRSPACGGGITYILGKHFTRPTVTFSRRGQPIGSSSSVIPGAPGALLANQTPSSTTQEDACWSEVADLLPDCISQHYLGCRIPAYPEVAINRPVYCEVTVTNGDNKVSDPAVFVYMPNEVLQEVSTLEAILSLPAAPLNQCPIMTIPTPAIAPSDLNNPQSIMTSTCSVSLSNNVMSSSVAASYSGGTSAKRSRTSQPENEVVMDQSPGSGSGGAGGGGGGGGGPVASDSNNSLNTKMGPSTVIANPTNQPAVTQSIPGTFPHGAYSNVPIQTLHITPAIQQSLGFTLNSVAAAASPCSLSGSSKPVPTVVHASGSQDPNNRLQFLTQPPVFQIPQQMALKSTPVQTGFSQQMLTNVSFANVGAVSSVNSSVFIKPESESSCGVKSNGGSCSQPIVMPRGLITHVPPAQSVLPHGPNLGNVSNFKIQQNVLPAASIIGGNGSNNVAFNDMTSGNPSVQQSQITQQQIMSGQSGTNVGQPGGSSVPMDISKAPIATAQTQPQQTQQNPPSDSPLTNAVLQNIVKSEDSASSQQVALNFPAAADSNTPDLNSIIKGLLLIGANSPNPSTYAEFVIQLVQHYHKDVGKNESSANIGTSSNPASVAAQPSVTSTQLDATPPPQSQMSLGGSSNSNPSSVNQMNYNSPGSSQQQQQPQSVNIQQHQIQTMQQQPPQVHSQQIQPAPVMVNSSAQQFTQVMEQGNNSQSFDSKLPSSQTAQLTVAAIAKNPDLAPFAPMLIDAVEALQKQQQPNFNTEQLLNLIEQEALKLANIAGSQQQQQQQAQNQQVTFSGQSQQQILQSQQVNQNQHIAQNQQIGQMSQQNSPQVTAQQNTAPQFNTVEQIAAQSLQNQQQQMVSSPPNQVFQQQPQQQQHQTQQGQQTYVIENQQQIQHQAPPPLVRHPSQPVPTQQQQPNQQQHMSQMQPCTQQNQSMSQNQQHQINGGVAPPVNTVDIMQQQTATIQNNQQSQQQQQLAGGNAMFYQIQTSGASVGAPSVAPQQQAQFQQSVINQQVQQQQPVQQQQQQSFIQQQQVQQQTPQNVLTQQTPTPQNQQIPTISLNQQQQQQQAMYSAQQQTQNQFQQVYYKPATNEFQPQRDQMQSSMVPQTIDQPPPSVNSAPPPSVASGPPPSVAPSSVLSAPEVNTTPTPAPGLQAQSSASMGNVQGFNQQQQPQQANTLQQQSSSSYVVFSQAQNVQHPMYYQIAQKVAPEMHSSNMDLTDPELYTTQQTPHKHSNPSQNEVEEHMFKEPYPVDHSQNIEWQHQQQQQTQQQRQGANMPSVQYVSQSVNDLQQHTLISQSQQQLNMSWEGNSNVARAPSQSSMNWESSSSSNSGNAGSSGMHHHPIPMKSSTTDPFLSTGSLESNQVQKVSSMMEIHSTFEHDQNSQGSSISSNDFHEFDSMFSQIAQSPLCTILNNDSLLTPSPAPPMTPEEPPARGAAVLKYLIEKGFIEGEQRNLVTAENIESAICSLSNQKPITEITFEDVVSVIAGTRST